MFWQATLLIAGTSWLWAAHLNHGLSYRTSLISQYETPGQPFSWLFRIGDFAAALLIFLAANYLLKSATRRNYGWLLLALSIGMMLDPLLSTTCRTVGDTCQEYFSVAFLIHAIETVYTAALFFALAVYDAWKRKKVISIGFAIFQIGYGVLFLSQLADQDHFNTLSQYAYQVSLIVWLAWLCRDLIAEEIFKVIDLEQKIARGLIAGWAFVNGILAIVISLAHISLLGRIRDVYFSGDTAWLAQHGVIVGVVMIYLSRHLARGEARARQIFLLLAGVETLKYALVSPHAGLLAFYMLTFVTLFLLRDDFDRGTIPLTWRIRLRDLYFLVSGLLLAALVSLLALNRDSRVSVAAGGAADRFSDFVLRDKKLPHAHINSALLAHSASVFIVTSAVAILWVLFRPYKLNPAKRDFVTVEKLLRKYSSSSEDFFKLWPADKDYYFPAGHQGFVAYKVEANVAFTLADPIGSDPKKLIDEFNGWCRQRRLKVCYLPVYQKSLAMYEAAALEPIQIGSSAVIDVKYFLSDTVNEKWWRWRINKSIKAGHEYQLSIPPHSGRFMRDLKQVSDKWLKTGGHAERGFALGHFDGQYLSKCRIHYLKDRHGRIIAFTNALPQFNQSRTMTVDLLRQLPDADSMAYLLYKTIESGAQSGYQKFDLGFVPFAKAKGSIINIAKALGGGRFSSKGLEQFKNKFNPTWEPNYLAYEGDLSDLAVIALSIEKVMAPGRG